MHFEACAEAYTSARPPYPEALWDHLDDLGLLRAGGVALDLGAGSGQATGRLIEAGLSVTAVEPGSRLAQRLREAHPAARVIIGRAEDVELPLRTFDLAVAATSIHWFDLEIVLPKVASVLKREGRFLVWRNVFGDAAAAVTPFRERIADIVRARTVHVLPTDSAEDLNRTVQALTTGGLFAVADSSTYRWTHTLDAAGVAELFDTFSDWSSDEVSMAVDAAMELGGTVVEHYTSWLLVLEPTHT